MPDESKKKKFQDIFDQIGIGNLPAEEKEKFFSEMGEVVEMGVIAKVARILSAEDKKKFDELPTDEGKEKFLAEKGIDLAAIAMEEAIAFREKFIADVNYITGRVEERKTQELKKKEGK